MKKLTLLMMVAFLAACSGGGSSSDSSDKPKKEPKEFFVIGDSLCHFTYPENSEGKKQTHNNWPDLLGFKSDCLAGRSITDDYEIPPGNIILSLGSNDFKMDEEEFYSHYSAIVDQVDGELWCVLPIFEGLHEDAIRSLCVNIIVPAKPDHWDNIHYQINAQEDMAWKVDGVLNGH